MRFLILFLVGCSVEVTVVDTSPPAEEEPGCELDSECAPTEFCLLEWCHGPDGCHDVLECKPKGEPYAWCEADSWCAEGLYCQKNMCGSHECQAGTCEAIPTES